jgi:prepilin-type N-terminal cleavage/methylation domain-containing protein
MKKTLVKKGFTLAELSIVLVILGIIIAMTLKGFGVLDAARLRNELGKINKFQTAYSLYFERTGHILPADPLNPMPGGMLNGRLDVTPLYEYGLLETDTEYNKDYTDGIVDNESIFLSMCDRNIEADNVTYLSSVEYINAGMADGVCLVFNKYYPNFICGAETSYDDMKIYDGSGRYWGGSGAEIKAEVDNWINGSVKLRYNCSRAEKGNTDYAWAYMIL